MKQVLLQFVSIFVSLKSMSGVFKILSQTGDMNIFLLRGVLSVIRFQIETSFSNEKNSTVESETHFCKEAVKV